MKRYISKSVAIAMSAIMFVSASANGFHAIGKQVADVLEQVRRGHPGAFTDKPVAFKINGPKSRAPETRALWSREALVAMKEKAAMSNCGPGTPHTVPIAVAPGGSLPWEGSINGINTGNGNKLTTIPLVSWKCRGGMVLDFTLYHNSETNYNDELGYGWTWSYDIYINDASTTATVHWGDGLCVPFTLSSAPPPGQTVTYTNPTGVYDTFTKNADGTWTLTKKDQTKYYFNTSGFCNRIEDRNGNAITITLNANNYATRITDPSGRYIDINVNGSNKFTSITDPLSRTWSFTINGSNDLSTVTWPTLNGSTYTDGFTYATHRITRHTDRSGKHWDTSYYTDGSVNVETDPLGHTTTYTGASSSMTITDALNHSIVHNYSSGRLSSEVDQNSYSVGRTYDSNNNVTQITDKRGKIWTCTYDSKSNVLTKTDPLSHVTTYTYNSKNDITSVQDALNHTMTCGYDTAGNLTSVTDPLNHVTGYAYDSYGLLTSTTDALNHTTTMSYDTYGNVTTITDPLSHQTTMTYNGIGLVTSTTDALSRTKSIAYDTWSRLTTITRGDSSTVNKTYNAVGKVLTVIDELSHTTTNVYDDAGRLTSVTNAKNEVESYGYDNANRRTTVTNGRNKTRTYAYNNRGDVTSLTLADNSVEQWSYNGNGAVTAYTNPLNQVIYYTYDDAGRKTGVDYPTGTDTSLSYDNANRQTQMVDSTGTTGWTYDNSNRVTALSTPQGSLSYTYNNNNSRATMVESAGTTTYGYDNAGRMTSLQNPYSETTTWTYNDANQTTRQTFASGAYTDYGYDSRGRQNAVTHKKSDGTVISSESYSYDYNGNMSSKTVDSVTTSYTYDNIDQLTGESRTGYVCTYTYDANGNRLTKTLNNVTENYSYDDADKMLSAGSKTYSYDAAGRTTGVTLNNQTTTISYDYEGRITQITYPDNSTNTFTYNGLDTRVGKTDSYGSKTFKRDGVGVTDSVLSDGVTAYTPGISTRESGASKFLLGDFLKTVTGETNASQNTTATRQYDAFGVLISSSGSSTSVFGFAGGYGYQEDPDSGLKLLGHRYYDSSTGRFLTRDPIKFGSNWYSYCCGSPTKWIDKLGLLGTSLDSNPEAAAMTAELIEEGVLAPAAEAGGEAAGEVAGEAAAEAAGEVAPINGNTPACQAGKMAHKVIEADMPTEMSTEFTIKGVGRADIVDWVTKMVYEIKPANATAILQGLAQAEKYAQALGPDWGWQVITYTVSPAGTLVYQFLGSL